MKLPEPYPLFEKISIECNSYCNRSCSFCTRSLDKREKARMPDELVYKVLYELAGIEYKGLISFHFYNEVFTDKRIFGFFETCQQLGLYNYLVTNGDYLTRDIVHRLGRYNIREFALSVYDWKTDEDFRQKCQRFKDTLPLEEYPWEFYIIKGGDSFGNRAGYVQHREEKLLLPVRAACSKIEKKIDVRYDGTVVMCCQDYYGIHQIGHVKDTHILDIWYGEVRQKQINDLRRGMRQSYTLCSRCSEYIVEL